MGALCGKVEVRRGGETEVIVRSSKKIRARSCHEYQEGDGGSYREEDSQISSKIVVTKNCQILGGPLTIEREVEEEFVKLFDTQMKMVQDDDQIARPIAPFLDEVDKTGKDAFLTHRSRLGDDQECSTPDGDRLHATIKDDASTMDTLHGDDELENKSEAENTESKSSKDVTEEQMNIMKTPSDWHRAFEEERAKALAEDRIRSTTSENQSTG
eukprot:763785-Hanusia_phi.AAC.1